MKYKISIRMNHDHWSIIQLERIRELNLSHFEFHNARKRLFPLIVRSIIICYNYYGYYCQFSRFYPPPPFSHTRKSLAYYFNVLVFRDNNSGASPSSEEIFCKAP